MKSSDRGVQFSVRCLRIVTWCLLVLIFDLKAEVRAQESNSIVRFTFQRGTNALGTVDVELFDSEKPETVRNFLLYVRSGAYTNSFLHRLVPGFIVQGGGFAMAEPFSADRFSSYLAVTNYGQVTNEFETGARISNTLGTLAMAKLGNDPNSASSQWFFNLGNNATNLDNQNGGFTVFGRVLESTSTSEGMSVLEHFNGLSTNAGIVNLGSLISSNYQVFASLPVSYTNSVSRVPLNRELYYVDISLLNNPRPTGATPPAVTLASPAPNSAFTNQVVRVSGTASDDVEVARVVYRLGDGPRQGAIGSTNWEFTLEPPPGFQTIRVESIDWEGNYSPVAALNFFYQRVVPLNLQIIGQGTVSGVTNGQSLNANTLYTATATPLPGNIFESWTGSVTSSSPTLTFEAPATATNFTVTAKFIADPLPNLTGTYQGLFQTLGPTDFDGAGYMTLSLQSDGMFSGSILHRGTTYYYTGRFDAEGNATIGGVVGGMQRTISLTLQKLNAGGVITGTFSGTGSTTLVQLERLASSLTGTNAPPAGKYTFVLPLNPTNTPSATTPGGHGFGTATLAANGTLTLSGTLGDGASFTATQDSTRLGRWPIYVTLDSGRGALWGWISSGTNATPKLQGSLTWLRTASGTAPAYPGGVTNQLNFAASPFQVVPGQRVLRLVHGVAQLAGTDLPPGFTNVVKLSTNNTFEVLEPTAGLLRLTLDQNSGLVSGSFVNPFFGTTNYIQGSVLTASNYIRGQYQSGSQVGSLAVDIAPFLVPQDVTSTTLPALLSAMSEGGVLRFQNDGIIELSAPLQPQFDTRLEANGHAVVIRGSGSTRLVEVPTNTAFSAVGITFAGGFHRGADGASGRNPGPGGDGFGGGIMSLGGPVALTNCIITNCVVFGGTAGADLFDAGAAAPGGRALGAALYSRGGLISLQSSTISGNQAVAGGNRSATSASLISQGMGMGAGLFSDGGECRIVNSIFENNLVRGGEALALSSTNLGRAGNAAGGAVAVLSGNLWLTNTQFFANSAAASLATNAAGGGHAYAGGLFLESNVVAVVERAVFNGNSALAGSFQQTAEGSNAEGGAIFNAGTLTLRDSSLEENASYGGAGAVAGYGRGGALAGTGSVVASGSTFSGNIAQGGGAEGAPESPPTGGEGAGGAIFIGNSLTITNSTFAYNRALGGSGLDSQTNAVPGVGRGGAIVMKSSSAALVHVTLAYNEAGANAATNSYGGGLVNDTGAITLRSSIVASNLPANFFGAVTDLGYNISSDASLSLTNAGSLTNKEALLGSFSTNGGFTRTIAILPESPARDAVRGAFPATDQRGTARPQGTYADSGAFEYVQTLPIFSVQPAGTNIVRLATNVVYQVQASGPGLIGYYWLKNGQPIAGAVSTALTLTNIEPDDAGLYAAVATNSFGASTSTVATLIVDARPVILVQPADVLLSPGAATSLVVSVAGPDLHYTWLRNQTPIPGATNASYPLPGLPGVEGSYQVVIANLSGAATSRVAAVAWSAAALDILAQPQSQTVGIGSPATLNVLASGVTPITYQWFKNNSVLPGETNNTLSFASMARTNSGTYYVVVANPFRTLTSTQAVVTVLAPPLLEIAWQGSSTIAVTAYGDPGRVHNLMSSTNLSPGATWTSAGTHTIPGSGRATWNLAISTNVGAVFFRLEAP